MDRVIALIRGINVGGNRIVKMQDLKALFENLGFGNVKTYIQSGNVVFDTEDGSGDEAIRTRIEAGMVESFGLEVSVTLRTAEELETVIRGNPYDPLTPEELKRLYVLFLAREPEQEALGRLAPYEGKEDRLKIIGREIYILYSTRASESPLFKVPLEKLLGVPATSRNWNTVTRLASMARE